MGPFELSTLHPALSGAPPTLLVCIVLLESVSCLFGIRSRMGIVLTILYGFLVPATIGAFLSGHPAADAAVESFGVSEEVISQHYVYGRAFLFSLLPLCALFWLSLCAERGILLVRSLYWCSLIISFGLVCVTGTRGGALVFEHGAGVKKCSAAQCANRTSPKGASENE